MKSKTKWTAIVAVAAGLVLAVVWSAEAGRHGRGKRGGFGPQGMHMKSEMRGLRHLVDLTEEQKAQIRTIREGYKERMGDLRDDIRASRESIRDLMDSGEFDEEAVLEAFRAGSGAREEAFVLGAKMRSEIKGVLTPEQVELLEKKRAKVRERMQHRLQERIEREKE